MISAVKKCQICGRPAHLFLTQVVNSEITELSLCETCAKDRGFFDPESLAMAEEHFPDAVKKKVDELAREIAEKLKNNESLVNSHPSPHRRARIASLKECSHCRFKLAAVASTGRVGCPECYTSFRHELAKLAKVLHYDADATDEITKSSSPDTPESKETKQHTIKVPVAQRRKILQTQMKKAIIQEDYERAALLRDELKKLESET